MLGKWQVDVSHSIIVTKQKFNNYLYLRDLGVIVEQFVTECEAVGFSDTFGPWPQIKTIFPYIPLKTED